MMVPNLHCRNLDINSFYKFDAQHTNQVPSVKWFCEKDDTDPESLHDVMSKVRIWLCLLVYSTLLLNPRLPLPAELFSGQKYRTLLPTCSCQTSLTNRLNMNRWLPTRLSNLIFTRSLPQTYNQCTPNNQCVQTNPEEQV